MSRELPPTASTISSLTSCDSCAQQMLSLFLVVRRTGQSRCCQLLSKMHVYENSHGRQAWQYANAPSPALTQPNEPVVNLPIPQGWKAELILLAGYIRSSNHLIATWPEVERTTSWSQVQPSNLYTTKPSTEIPTEIPMAVDIKWVCIGIEILSPQQPPEFCMAGLAKPTESTTDRRFPGSRVNEIPA